MLTIWKYPLSGLDTTCRIPSGGRVLSAHVQGGTICIWVLVDDTIEARETRRFCIFGTGLPVYSGPMNFIGTALLHDEKLVWHVFERIAL